MALDRGQRVHTATQYDDEGALDEDTVAPDIAPYLAAWRNFRRNTGFLPSLIEHRGFNPAYRFAGTLDRTGTFNGSSTVLLDIKTNQAEWWVRVQLAAYASFFENPRTYRRLCVELHADETYRICEFASRTWLDDFNIFLAALGVFNAKRRNSTEAMKAA
jgi:hypothetical protein